MEGHEHRRGVEKHEFLVASACGQGDRAGGEHEHRDTPIRRISAVSAAQPRRQDPGAGSVDVSFPRKRFQEAGAGLEGGAGRRQQ